VLGLQVAHHLADRGATRLVLATRRALPKRSAWDAVTDEPTGRMIDGIRALENRGVTVRAVALDVADRLACARLLEPDALGLPPIRGIVHAAGVLDNRMVAGVDEASVAAVLGPKVAGSWALHELFAPGSLDFFVLFSSCGQLLGMPGQATYGAANAFLDALARHRPDTLSLGWTSWQGQGMAVNDVVDRELAARGVTTITAAEAFDAWDLAARRGPGHYPVLAVHGGETRETLPLLRDLTAQEPAVADGPGRPDEDDLSASGTPEELREHLRGLVGSQIATEMRLPVTTLDVRRSLIEQGLDSVMTIVIRKRLEKRFGHKLPATLLWHQPTVTAIAEHLAGVLEQSHTVTAGDPR
jgi:6-methylsalicylic acid synthase